MTNPKIARLTLHLTPAQKELITQAAAIAGVTLTEFVTAAAEARARDVISGDTMYLNAERSKTSGAPNAS